MKDRIVILSLENSKSRDVSASSRPRTSPQDTWVRVVVGTMVTGYDFTSYCSTSRLSRVVRIGSVNITFHLNKL